MSSVDPFEYLTYDKMIEICESLDTKSLSQVVRTSKKAYEICQDILGQRKRIYEEYQNRINSLADSIKKANVSVFLKTIGNVKSVIEISSGLKPFIKIDQHISGGNMEEVKNVSWPLLNIPYSQMNSTSMMSSNVIQVRYSSRLDKTDSLIRELAKFLIDQDYVHRYDL